MNSHKERLRIVCRWYGNSDSLIALPGEAWPGCRTVWEVEEDRQMTENVDMEKDASWPRLEMFPFAASGRGFYKFSGEGIEHFNIISPYSL